MIKSSLHLIKDNMGTDSTTHYEIFENNFLTFEVPR